MLNIPYTKSGDILAIKISTDIAPLGSLTSPTLPEIAPDLDAEDACCGEDGILLFRGRDACNCG
jgi:hypothetical protein